MNDLELVSIIEAYRKDSLGVEDGELSVERADALDRYHGRPYGDEKQNRSSVVSRDLAETVEWAMPAIMRVFVQSGNIAEFTPTHSEEEDQVQIESDFVNQIIMEDNHGFLVVYDAVKDSLILKNGYFKHYWHEEEKITEHEFKGLTPDELLIIDSALSQRGEVEVLEQEELTETFQIEINGEKVEQERLISIDVKLQLTEKVGSCIVEAVPPEEVRVSKDCRGSLQDAAFVEHVTTRTRSQLIQMGMDEAWVNELPAYEEDENDDQAYSRDSVSDESDEDIGISYDRSMHSIRFCEAYLRVDFDGDGIAELRKVTTCADRIPPGDEWNEKIKAVPMTGMVPKRIPHRHVGESLADELEDLGRIKTVLTRQLLDNAYLTNNQEWLVNERVHLPDFMRSLPGGIKRIRDNDPVNGSAAPVPVQPIIGQVLPVIDYIDQVKANRTGIDRSSTGLDPDILKQSTKGAFLENLNRASQKIEMIIRLLAETGIKELVIRVREILMDNMTNTVSTKLRGQYQRVNPSQWPERTKIKVNVGIGTGTEEEKRQKLLMLDELQQRLRESGIVLPRHEYSLFEDMAKIMGFDTPERYALNPDSQEYRQLMKQQQMAAQRQPNPLAEAEQIKGQFNIQIQQLKEMNKREIETLKESAKLQMDQFEFQKKQEMELLKLQLDQANNRAEIISREAIEAAKLEVKAFLEGMKIDIGKPGVGAGIQRTYDPMTGTLI